MKLQIPPALRHRNFRLLWIGLLISIMGSQMQFWALLWHIRELVGEELAPGALGGVGAARLVPLVMFSLFGGVVADTLDRRKIMGVTQTVMLLTALALGWLTLGGEIALWQIYLLTALQTVAASFDLPARQALVPNLVPAKDLSNALSMTSIAFQTGSIVGPAVTGVVIATAGLEAVYFANAVSFLAVIGALLMMRGVQQVRAAPLQRGGGVQSIREGVAFLRTKPIIFSSMLLDFFATFFSSANALMPIFARDILHVGEVGFGWLSAAQSIGATLAAGVLSQVRELRRQGPVLLWAVIVFGVGTVVFGMAVWFWLAMLALMVMGASDTVSAIIRSTARQLHTPDELRGRMVSINQMFFIGGPQLGEVEAGAVAQFFGAPFAVISGGAACILSVWWVARRWPELANYDREPLPEGAAAD
jgi:MFS family permease